MNLKDYFERIEQLKKGYDEGAYFGREVVENIISLGGHVLRTDPDMVTEEQKASNEKEE